MQVSCFVTGEDWAQKNVAGSAAPVGELEMICLFPFPKKIRQGRPRTTLCPFGVRVVSRARKNRNDFLDLVLTAFSVILIHCIPVIVQIQRSQVCGIREGHLK